MPEEALRRRMMMLHLDTADPAGEIWKEICVIFCDEPSPALDKKGQPILTVKGADGRTVRLTLTNLLNEVFVTLFADNQPFISAITPGCYHAPLTYSLTLMEDAPASDKCIFIVEDSQLDIGLLIAVERNLNRIFQIIADYLNWNEEQLSKPDAAPEAASQAGEETPFTPDRYPFD